MSHTSFYTFIISVNLNFPIFYLYGLRRGADTFFLWDCFLSGICRLWDVSALVCVGSGMCRLWRWSIFEIIIKIKIGLYFLYNPILWVGLFDLFILFFPSFVNFVCFCLGYLFYISVVNIIKIMFE